MFAFSDLSELGAPAVGLLEVEADDLLELCPSLAYRPLEPVGETLVKLGPSRLSQRLVGGVSDQEVTEAVGVLGGMCRAHGPDQIATDERPEHAVDGLAGPRGREIDDRAGRELATGDRGALEHRTFVRLQSVEPC